LFLLSPSSPQPLSPPALIILPPIHLTASSAPLPLVQ